MIFIAEIGLNHNGNFALAHELIRQASRAGADIVKFQLGWRDQPGEMNALDEETLRLFHRSCDHFGTEMMVSVFHTAAFDLAEKIGFRRYKIASRTVVDHPEVVRRVLDTGKETYVSLGMWDGAELPFEPRENLHYLWCKSKYPSYPWDLTDLPKDFETGPYSGYSDHSVGIATPLLAIARGAGIVEKHFTLDKSDTTIRDHAMSATPDELERLVRTGREMFRQLQLGV